MGARTMPRKKTTALSLEYNERASRSGVVDTEVQHSWAPQKAPRRSKLGVTARWL